jgi:hypothetical protein
MQAIVQSPVFFAVSTMFFYFPVSCYLFIFMAQITVVDVVNIGSILRWLTRVHTMESLDALIKFLKTPLSIAEGSSTQRLLDLDKTDIDALHSWSQCRRQIVQDKLLPTTLILAFLGLLANTQLGEEAVLGIRQLLNTLVGPTMTFEWLWAIGKFFLLGLAIVVPLIYIKDLLDEAFVMDYITEAAILAKCQWSEQKASDENNVNTRPRQTWWERLWRLFRES